MRYHNRRGVTLIELVIALTISMGVGAAMFALLAGSTRFHERAESQRSARLVARNSVNLLVNDLRLIDPAWGITSASTTSIYVKSPYAIGVVCDIGGGPTGALTIAVLPVDSVIFARTGYSGYAWRANNGNYTPIDGGTLTTAGTFPATCTAQGVAAITAPASAPNQKTINATISGTTHTGVTPGTVVMFYREVGFYFANSAVTGLTTRTALWRDTVDGAGAEEIAAPFDNTAAFNFYVSGSNTPSSTVPGTLSTLRGFLLFLPGESETTARQRTTPEQANLTTSVFFLNAAS